MNIEKIANKLKPLMPNKVAHWMKTRELADPDLQALIEKQVISAAYNHLAFDAVVLSIFLFWFIVKFTWNLSRYINFHIFELPWY